jgi:AraC family transcriptional regulator of adaptative response/methylated-DNA-[protein]-cysteine methyltransferase
MEQLSDQLWEQVQRREAYPPFLFGVVSTGVFCRPGCPARTPLRRNTIRLETPQAAVEAGFRPCRKCRPMGDGEAAARISRLLAAMQADPDARWTDEEVGAACDAAIRTVRRDLRDLLGTTPTQLRDAVRLQRFKQALGNGESVTDATYAAGYSGPARRHAATGALGMTARAYAKGAAAEEIRYALAETELGVMSLAATARGICALRFAEDEDAAVAALRAEFPRASLSPAGPGDDVVDWAAAVALFLRRGGRRPDLPLDVVGTAFQLKVWRALKALGPGEIVTYGELAARIGHAGASRAVGSANARNPVAILVPCHLVNAAGGKLGGYAYGLDRKQRLQALERRGS